MTGQPARFDPEGFYVAMDTSSPVGYVAVSKGGKVLARETLHHRGKHAGHLVPAIHQTLQECGGSVAGLSGVVVGEGPGSFTGVRVAAATAKGLSRARGVPLWAVSSLAAVAIASRTADSPAVRYVIFDARAERVYAACYGIGRAGVECLVPPHPSDLRTVLGEDIPVGAEFVGDGAEKHRAAIEGAGYPVTTVEGGVRVGDGLIEFLRLHPEARPVEHLDTWEPRYLKASSAERAWNP